MTTMELIEQLRCCSVHPMTKEEDLMQEAADRLERMEAELKTVRAERDVNVKAYISVSEELANLKKGIESSEVLL